MKHVMGIYQEATEQYIASQMLMPDNGPVTILYLYLVIEPGQTGRIRKISLEERHEQKTSKNTVLCHLTREMKMKENTWKT